MNEEFEIVMETGDAFGNEDGKPENLKSKLSFENLKIHNQKYEEWAEIVWYKSYLLQIYRSNLALF